MPPGGEDAARTFFDDIHRRLIMDPGLPGDHLAADAKAIPAGFVAGALGTASLTDASIVGTRLVRARVGLGPVHGAAATKPPFVTLAHHESRCLR